MWSIEAMLAFIFFVIFSHLSVIDYADSAAPIAPAPVAQPQPTQTPTNPTAAGFPNQQPGQQGAENLIEASSRLASMFGAAVLRFIRYKKNSLSTGLESVSNMFANSTQFGQPGRPTSPAPISGVPQTTPAAPTQIPPAPVQTPPVTGQPAVPAQPVGAASTQPAAGTAQPAATPAV